jgi:hypothetical protein
MLGVASATGLLAKATDATAQRAPNPGATAVPRTGNFILRGGYVITMDRALGDIPIGDVHVRNGEIVPVATSVEAAGAEIVNAQGMIVMPGCVDTHSHVWNALLKNMPRSGAEYFPLKDVFTASNQSGTGPCWCAHRAPNAIARPSIASVTKPAQT